MKQKAEKPKVWDGKKRAYVDASQSLCDRCGKKEFIAMRGSGRKICFPCFEEQEKKWDKVFSSKGDME